MKRYALKIGYVAAILGILVCCLAAFLPKKTDRKAEPAVKETDELGMFRLERDQIRAMRLNAIDEILQDETTSQEMTDRVREEKLMLLRQADAEQTMCELLSSMGFSEPVVVACEDGATILLRAKTLSEKEKARISEAAVAQNHWKLSEIKIIPIN